MSHNKCLIWHKTAVTTLKQSLSQMYPHVVLKNLEYFSHAVDDVEYSIFQSETFCIICSSFINNDFIPLDIFRDANM